MNNAMIFAAALLLVDAGDAELSVQNEQIAIPNRLPDGVDGRTYLHSRAMGNAHQLAVFDAIAEGATPRA